MGSLDDAAVDADAVCFFVFVDGDNGGDLFVRIFFSTADWTTVSVSVACTIDEDVTDSCFTVDGLTSISDSNPK